MLPVLTADEAREIERESVARGTSVATLMERAGHAVARAAAEVAGGAYGRRAVVVCGKGNNAGDGFVAARHLDSWGMGVTVVTLAEDLAEPASANLHALGGTGVRVVPFGEASLVRELERGDVAIDAILGIGMRGAPRSPYAEAISLLNDPDVRTVCVDIPSGVDADTGSVPGAAVRQLVTVTFGAPKVGNLLPPGAYPAGAGLVVADIGYPEDLIADVEPHERYPWPVALVEEGEVWVNPRAPDAHKRDAVVLVVAGSRRMTGAPALVARGAYRAGAGLVTLAVPESILPVVQAAVPEAVFLPLPESSSGAIAESAWDLLGEHLPAAHALAVGPGLSTDPATGELVRRLVSECPVPMVVDADAINAFAGRAEELAVRKAAVVITPHAGELERLLGRTAGLVAHDRLGSVRAAAGMTEAAVLLKGWPTLVCEPGGRVKLIAAGTPALATAGTGDVLTGVIAGLTARGFGGAWEGLAPRWPVDEEAVNGAMIHALAGRTAAERLGEGTTATDVADAVAPVIRDVQGRG